MGERTESYKAEFPVGELYTLKGIPGVWNEPCLERCPDPFPITDPPPPYDRQEVAVR